MLRTGWRPCNIIKGILYRRLGSEVAVAYNSNYKMYTNTMKDNMLDEDYNVDLKTITRGSIAENDLSPASPKLHIHNQQE